MSQPNRRSRKSKLVPRSIGDGEPEIEEVIESEEEEPPIKIMNTMSLAAPQPGTSKSGSIQFKVDIEVEEWIDDDLFIEENFKQMQSEKLSKTLDKEITEEADWTNEEFGRIWAEAASDSEQEEKPLNEYEKLIKNYFDPSVLGQRPRPSKDGPESFKDRKGPSKDRPGSFKDKPGSSTDRPGSSKDRPGSSEDRPGPSKDRLGSKDRPGTSKDWPVSSEDRLGLSNDRPGPSKDSPGSSKDRPGSSEDRPGSSKDRPVSSIDRPVSSQDRPGSSKNRPELSKDRPGSSQDRPGSSQDRPGTSQDRPGTSQDRPARSQDRPRPSKDSMDLRPRTSKENACKMPNKEVKKVNNPNENEKDPSEESNKDYKIIRKRSARRRPKAAPKMIGTIQATNIIKQYRRIAPKPDYMATSSKLVIPLPVNSSSQPTSEQKSSSIPKIKSSLKLKTFKWSKNTKQLGDLTPPKAKINILYSDEAPKTFHIVLAGKSKIDLPPPTLEDKTKTMINDLPPPALEAETKTMINNLPPPTLVDKTKTMINKRRLINTGRKMEKMTITELDAFEKTHTVKQVSRPHSPMVELKQIIINEDAILADSKVLAGASTDPTDHILDIELRNRMGNTRFVRMEMSREDALIEYGLREWFKWIGSRRSGCTPLTYKCYICNKGWWHLDPFRKHLNKHVIVNVILENQNQECNLVAHNGKSNFRFVSIPGECWICGRGYSSHSGAGTTFTCQGCQSTLVTCKQLAEHRGICLNIWKDHMEKQNSKDIKAYQCKICPQIFFTEEFLHAHQYRYHVPLSDYPMCVQLNQCSFCHQNYVYYPFHHCGSRIQKFRCQYCSRHFPSILALKFHMTMIKSNVACTICKENVSRDCMMPRHLLVHNKNYVMVYKCLMCVGKHILLGDLTMATRHAEFVHKSNKYVRRMWCYAQVLIPVKFYSLKVITTMHKPTSMHDKLKQSFLKDQLQYNPMEVIEFEDESQEPPEEKVYEDSTEEKVSQDSTELQDFQEYSELQDSQDSLEQEAPTIKIENVMENYFEEDNMEPEFKPQIVDISSIKLEINENVEGSEVNPADLMNMTEFELLKEVKKEPDDDLDVDTYQNMDESISDSEANTSKNTLDKDFSVQLLTYLNNRDGDGEEEEIKDNVNICLNCDFEGTKKEFKKHLKKCSSGEIAKKQQEVTCTKCSKDFTCMKEYVRHLPKHGFAWCKCTECDRTFACVYNWMTHIKTHIRRTYITVKLLAGDTKVFRCRVCKEFVERKMFFKHWELHLESPQKKKSLEASLGIKEEGSVSTQILDRIEEIFKMSKTSDIPMHCIICEKFFCRMNEKKRHLVEHLLDAASEQVQSHGGLVCQFCGVRVFKPDQFRRHMRDHAGLTLYHCEFCNKTFSDSSNFVKHKKVHGVEAFICDVCKKKFLSKASLVSHIATHRTQPLRCVHCPGKEFFSDSAYNRHVRSQHQRFGFKCLFCRERFPSVKLKWDHQWEKHKVRSQKADCPVCGKKFRRILDVRAHLINEHNAEKVYKKGASSDAKKTG